MTDLKATRSGIRFTIIFVSVIGVVGAIILLTLLHGNGLGREPVYAGRKFSAWFSDLNPDGFNPGGGSKAAITAFRAMGPAVLPFLAERADAHESGLDRFRRMMLKMLPEAGSMFGIPQLDQSWQVERAIWCLGELGPMARPALSTVTNSHLVWTKALIFDAWTKIEPTNTIPVTELCKLMKSPQQYDRYFAARALAHSNPAITGVIDALIIGLKDGDREVRASSAESLRAIGPVAHAAIPVLQHEAFVAIYPHLQVNVGRALWRIDPSQNDLAAETLGRSLKGKNLDAWNALKYLIEMGPAAHAAIPALEEFKPRDPETQARRDDLLKLLRSAPSP